ncbi:hypothetical protein EVAR_92192_1 [Eumeta japonica]|uniref:Uncharacterized protein n=1 Tax=Eumeta variegata TaxID=151549 RepID=A0A4C1S8K4_EUMVA|nr:hypothetical protein EVAR_92192_1 [Eumeta japonica]
MLYRVYYGECYEELFNLIPAPVHRHRRTRLQYDRYRLEGCHSTTERFMRDFTRRAVEFWNDLPTVASAMNFDEGSPREERTSVPDEVEGIPLSPHITAERHLLAHASPNAVASVVIN